MSESRARKKIRRAFAELGLGIESIEWEPIGMCIEMQGREGGWSVWLDEESGGGHVMGYNVDDLIDSAKVHKSYIRVFSE